MATAAKKKYDKSLINFYEELLAAHADTVYRFAYGLTLNVDVAKILIHETYQNVVASLEQYRKAGESSVPPMLVAEAWKTFKQLKAKTTATGQSAVSTALKPLAIEPRAALLAVDVCGLAPAEAAGALGWQENDLRVHLATARRTLISQSPGL